MPGGVDDGRAEIAFVADLDTEMPIEVCGVPRRLRTCAEMPQTFATASPGWPRIHGRARPRPPAGRPVREGAPPA